MRRFLTRFPEGGGQLIPPPPMTGLLFWDDVGSISPQPANGANVTSVPVFPGTPTTQSGITVRMAGTFGGAFPGIYRANQMPSGAAAVDMRGGQFAHQGGAFTNYVTNNPGGLTIYQRVWLYAGIVGNLRALYQTNTGSQVFQFLLNCPTDVNDFTLQIDGNNLATFTGGALKSGVAYTFAAVLPPTGQYTIYQDGAAIASKNSGQVTFETSNSGFGCTIGQGDNTSTYGWSSFLGYQAIHSPAQVALISDWLRINR